MSLPGNKPRVSAPGCDDAPVVKADLGLAERPIQLIHPYYENPLRLAWLVNHLMGLSRPVRDALTVLIVDDGSPHRPIVPAALEPLCERGIGVRAWRIKVDVRWNWLAARNIAMHHAKPGWCLLTDIDHTVPAETFTTLLRGRFNPEAIYRFSRRERSGEKINPHPNSWWLTRDMFWRIGGYDEALSGHYGTDGEFRRRAAKTAPIFILEDELERWEFHEDSSTTIYKRKQPEDRAGVAKLVRARGADWQPRHLSFPYEELKIG